MDLGEKEFSKEFQLDLLDLYEASIKNKTDNITVTFDYGPYTLEADMTFRLTKK